MRVGRWFLVPRDVHVAGLEANVGKLQRSLTKSHAKRTEIARRIGMLKGQIREDQRYIDELERHVPAAIVAQIRAGMKR